MQSPSNNQIVNNVVTDAHSDRVAQNVRPLSLIVHILIWFAHKLIGTILVFTEKNKQVSK